MRSLTRYRTAQFSSKIACHDTEWLGCRFLFLLAYSIYFFSIKIFYSNSYFVPGISSRISLIGMHIPSVSSERSASRIVSAHFFIAGYDERSI